MNWAGKLIGIALGFLFAGPPGALLGLFLGHLFLDEPWLRRWLKSALTNHSAQPGQRNVFFSNTFRVMGCVAKADGRVSENEIQQVRQIMQQMGLNENLKREAIRLFTEGKQTPFNLAAAIAQVKQACALQPNLLHAFLEMQMQVAYADGRLISPHKREVLLNICRQLGISVNYFNQFEQQFRSSQNNYQRYQQTVRPDPRAQLQNAYRILGLAPTADDAEVKKAYRRLMSRHHPDKLMAKGLSPEMIKMATQKTQQIKSAYEQISESRKVHA